MEQRLFEDQALKPLSLEPLEAFLKLLRLYSFLQNRDLTFSQKWPLN